MHEFSIAQNIVDIACETAKANQAATVTEVHVEVGQASGVVQEALIFALESAVKGTVVEPAQFFIHEIPVICKCHTCGNTFDGTGSLSACPSCGEFSADLVSGRELRVKSIVLE